MPHTLGTHLPRWAPRCWEWLHGAPVPLDVLLLVPHILPCATCSLHMLSYMAKHPIRSPSSWVVDLHNDVNRRLQRRVFSYRDAAEHHRLSDAREAFVQFIFAASFCATASSCSALCATIRRGCDTVGIPRPTDLPGNVGGIPEALYNHLRPFRYPTFAALVCDFVGPARLGDFGADVDQARDLRELPPCTSPRSLATYVSAELANDSELDMRDRGPLEVREYVRRTITKRVHRICPGDIGYARHTGPARRTLCLTVVGVAFCAYIAYIAHRPRSRRRVPRT